MKRITITLILFFGITGKCFAGFYSAERLYNDCKSENKLSNAFCYVYIMGVFDHYETKNSCSVVVGNITSDQISKIFIKYLNENPKYLNYSAADIIAGALDNTYKAEMTLCSNKILEDLEKENKEYQKKLNQNVFQRIYNYFFN